MINIIDKLIDKSEKLAIILLVLMFLLSGINKIFLVNETVSSLQGKLPYLGFHNLIIVAVILLEIILSIIIIYYAISGNNKREAYYSVIGLIIFTLLATFIYHPPDFTNYKRSIPFWANISLLGGLLLLTKIIKNK